MRAAIFKNGAVVVERLRFGQPWSVLVFNGKFYETVEQLYAEDEAVDRAHKIANSRIQFTF